MIRKYKKIISVIGIATVSFFVYLYFSGGSDDPSLIKSSVNSSSGSVSGSEAIGSEIIQALNQIEILQLDRKIFEDPVYRSLVDRSEILTPEPVGRNNPFAPIGVTANSQTTVEVPSSTPVAPTTPTAPSVTQ